MACSRRFFTLSSLFILKTEIGSEAITPDRMVIARKKEVTAKDVCSSTGNWLFPDPKAPKVSELSGFAGFSNGFPFSALAAELEKIPINLWKILAIPCALMAKVGG